MAIHSLELAVVYREFYDGETGQTVETYEISRRFNGSLLPDAPMSSSEYIEFNPGDYVDITWTNLNTNLSDFGRLAVYGFAASVWEDTSTVYFYAPFSQETVRRRIKTNADFITDFIGVDTRKSNGDYITGNNIGTQTVDPVDARVDPFPLDSLDNIYPGESVTLESFRVEGANANNLRIATSSNYGTLRVRINNGSPTTLSTVDPGDLVTPVFYAPNTNNRTATVFLSIGEGGDKVTESAYMTTMGEESIGKLDFPFAQGSTFGLNDVAAFFGQRAWNEARLSDYYRGGPAIPYASENSDISTSSNSVSLASIGGSVTTIYFSVYPRTKSDSKDTSTGAKTLRAEWHLGTDYDVGYGDYIRNTMLLQFRVIVDGPRPSGFTVSPSDADGGWSSFLPYSTDPSVLLSMTAGYYTEKKVRGTVYMRLKHPSDTTNSQTIEAQAVFILDAYGP